MAEGSQVRLPACSLEQRLSALRRANDIRSARAALKKQLAAGERHLDELLVDAPAYAHGAKVYDLLLAVPKLGPARARHLLAHCKISETKTLAGLTERQRSELIASLHR